MVTPYDWQEAIGHRAQFIESRLASGVPVAAVSLEEGIVAATFRRQSPKIFEIYDRLMYSALGQQSDVESLRVTAIDYAHREGYQRSEQDVTIQRIVTAMSQPIKDAFANFSSSPWIAKALFMEVGETMADDRFYCIDYDGDYINDHLRCCLCGTPAQAVEMQAQVAEIDVSGKKPKEMASRLRRILVKAMAAEGTTEEEAVAGLTFEAALLGRHTTGDRRLQRLTPEDL